MVKKLLVEFESIKYSIPGTEILCTFLQLLLPFAQTA